MIRLRRYLVAGLLVWVPFGVTILVFRLLLGFMDRFLFWLPAQYRPDQLIGHQIPGLSSILAGILAFIVLLGTGIFAANIIGKQLVAWYEALFARIPFVRSVYGAVKNFTEVLFSDTDRSFKRVVLVQYPRTGVYSLAFQTSENASEVQARTGETIVTVFVPTTPNPTSGFIVFLPRSEVIELEMSVEDAIKMIVSLGVVVPKWHPAHPKPAATPGSSASPAAAAPLGSPAAFSSPATASSPASPAASSLGSPAASSLGSPAAPSLESHAASASPGSPASAVASPSPAPSPAKESERGPTLARPRAAP